jgi:serine/threonine protein kinase
MGLPPQFHWGGRVLADRYPLEARVASGAHGVLYRGRDRNGGALVAAKLLHSRQPGDESQLPSLLAAQHPRLGRVLDVGTSDGQPFVVSEWQDGYFLLDETLAGPLAPQRILTLLRSICDGLAALHGAGQAHGAVKIGNVAVGWPASATASAGDEVRLCDPLLPGWTMGETRPTADQDVAAAVEILRRLLADEGAPEPLRQLAVQKHTSAADLGSACQACLQQLPVEVQNLPLVRKPPQPVAPPAVRMPTNWSPPPPPREFRYGRPR